MILNVAQLTPSGRPVLQPGEVEVLLLDKVDLEFHPVGGLPGQQAEAYKHGYTILTNRRLIWVDANTTASGGGAPGGSGGAPARAASLPLAAIAACGKKVQYSLKGSKVRVIVEVYTDPQLQPVPVSGFHTNIELLGLRCRGPSPDTFITQLQEQVKQAVAADAAAPPPGAGAGTATAAAGGGTPSRPMGSSPSPAAFDPHASPLRAGLQARTSLGTPDGGGGPAARASPAGPGPGSAGAGGQGGRSPVEGATGPSAAAGAKPDMAMLQTMVEMGFPRNRCERALMATHSQGVQEAIDYLLAFGEQPGMDDPWVAPAVGAPTAVDRLQPTASGEAGMRYPNISPLGAVAGTNPYSHQAPDPGPNAYLYGGPYPGTAAAAGAGGSGQLVSPLMWRGFATGGPQTGGQYQQPYQHSLQHQNPHPYSSEPGLRAAEAAAAGSRAIGVAGIVKREQQKTAESGRAVEEAFRDLSALMSSAATMVALAEKFRGVLGVDGAPGGGDAGSGAGEDPLLMDAETQQQLIALGISSPVTREIAGARYHIELSRQLADFLDVPLQRVGGLMSLPDVYCLFNRARGTELVSPDDLLQAAKLFTRAGVSSLRLRPLSSGVLVIQGPQHSEERVCAKISELTRPSQTLSATPASPLLGPGLTAGDIALALGGISVAIAAEHLLMAEARGVVCRDDGPEGLRFYRNFFTQDKGLLAGGG